MISVSAANLAPCCPNTHFRLLDRGNSGLLIASGWQPANKKTYEENITRDIGAQAADEEKKSTSTAKHGRWKAVRSRPRCGVGFLNAEPKDATKKEKAGSHVKTHRSRTRDAQLVSC